MHWEALTRKHGIESLFALSKVYNNIQRQSKNSPRSFTADLRVEELGMFY
jgi:hypothetical protein